MWDFCTSFVSIVRQFPIFLHEDSRGIRIGIHALALLFSRFVYEIMLMRPYGENLYSVNDLVAVPNI